MRILTVTADEYGPVVKCASKFLMKDISTIFKGLFGKLALERAHSNIPILSSLQAPFIKKTANGGEMNDIQMTMFLDSI